MPRHLPPTFSTSSIERRRKKKKTHLSLLPLTMTAVWLDAVLAQRGSRAPPYRPESKQAVKRHLVDLVQVSSF